jgi:excisionase family DNA binding protein
MPERDKPWGTIELAEAAGVTESYIRRLARAGKFPGAYQVGRVWLIPAHVGDAWLKERQGKWRKF